jgi:ABC-2 type transport system ATP-binding protein
MIEINRLTKRFGQLAAVSLQVRAGEVYGLLGPNGAGKTTLLHIVAGLDQSDSGEIRIGGALGPPWSAGRRKKIGLVPQEAGFYTALTARENLQFWGAMYELKAGTTAKRADELLRLVGLSERANTPVGSYSGGMKRRLNLALGLVHTPTVLLLDEPTLEVDPQSRRQIVDLIRQLATDGAAILYTTHQLSDAQEVCDRIGIMDHGALLAEGTMDELRDRMPAANCLVIILHPEVPTQTREAFEGLPGSGPVTPHPQGVSLSVTDAKLLLEAVAPRLSLPGVLGIRMEEASLEEVFFHLTGKGVRD